MSGPDLPRRDVYPTAWMDGAACVDRPDLDWFPHRTATAAIAAAKAVCATCPVATECLEAATTNREMSGIWGGVTAPGRHYRRNRQLLVRHGTAAGYRAHLRRKQRPCFECAAAARVYEADRRATQ